MKKLILVTTIALSLSLSGQQLAHASSKSDSSNKHSDTSSQETKNDLVGFGTGAAFGAAVAGPVGAVVGGVFGLFIADDVNDHAKMEQKNTELAQATAALQQQQNDFIALQNHYQDLQQQQMVQLASFDEQSHNEWMSDVAKLTTNLQFKTASFLIENTYSEQLESLASLLSSYPELAVKITGYADSRGDSQFNKTLSEQRAKAVKDYLTARNVNESQISIVGAGEIEPTLSAPVLTTSASLEQTQAVASREDLFFARKVNISIITPEQQMTAAN